MSTGRSLDFGVGSSWLRGHPQGPETDSGRWLPATSDVIQVAQVSPGSPSPIRLVTLSGTPAYNCAPRVCVYYCRTYDKVVRGGGGGEWTTCAMIDDEPRPVWTSLPITH